MNRFYLVTGGTGFLGCALVRRLVLAGHRVRVLDNESRGNMSRLDDLKDDIHFVNADIRDSASVIEAARGVDAVCHLAAINGTEFFYAKPELVLEVGVKGIVNVVDACRMHRVEELIVASSSEVYHHPPRVPTDESVSMRIPDPQNPRYSYAGSKVISELYALNFGRRHIDRVVVFRPHNVYGPDMGWEHVIPQFVLRMKALCDASDGVVSFPIQGSGEETRSFVYIDDFTDGLMRVIEHGKHMNIYHIGTTEERSIAHLARVVGGFFGRQIEIIPGELAAGGTSRRCPDIAKISALSYEPKYTLEEGLRPTATWYVEHAGERFPRKTS